MATSLYPPNPADVPADLTVPTSAFRIRALVLLVALTAFFTLYVGLISYNLLFLTWTAWAVFYLPWDEPLWLAVKIGSLVLALPIGVVLFDLVRALGKCRLAYKPEGIEIFEHEHPRLFAFIDQLCKDVGVEPPRHVYVDHHVNAAAIPEASSLRDVLMPTRKNLRLGLGLVNCLNLTQFKAILAHEFGHFTQRTTRLAFGVQAAALIVAYLSHRDRWGLLGVRWCVRKLLGAMWRCVFLARQALRRQEELHADLVAVRLTGSDAPIHAFARCDVGQRCWQQAIHELKRASEQQLYSSDLFYHQRAAMELAGRDEPLAGDRRLATVFVADEDEASALWEDHPSNAEREANAKARFIKCETDERSAWLLFDEMEVLCNRISCQYCRQRMIIPDPIIPIGPTVVEGVVDARRPQVPVVT
ncbi:MAG: M48 family metallopeptidase [Planctomycetes bacterium]|nr:M48 family metallopeptidase [Planctomycetota bacterium]